MSVSDLLWKKLSMVVNIRIFSTLFCSNILYVYWVFEPYFPQFSTMFDYILLILHNKMLRVRAKTYRLIGLGNLKLTNIFFLP